MHVDVCVCTYTYISVHVLCNLFSFMGSTRRRQLNIYYRRFRCFVPCNSVLLLLLLLLLLLFVCFVRCVWLLFWFLFHSHRCVCIVERACFVFAAILVSIQIHFRAFHIPRCLYTKSILIDKVKQRNELRMQKQQQQQQRLFLEILWCTFCNDNGQKHQWEWVLLHIATVSHFLSDSTEKLNTQWVKWKSWSAVETKTNCNYKVGVRVK